MTIYWLSMQILLHIIALTKYCICDYLDTKAINKILKYLIWPLIIVTIVQDLISCNIFFFREDKPNS